MTYQVLARKWRPKSFSTMVGQEHVVKAMINALNNDRLHHAYLFTGTRGVGKTTIARIFAKCLNCEEGVSATPCGTCSTCMDIDAGRFFDLIEVDAASRTKVEETRELLDNVPYAPARGRYKVYLIDEVHMFSRNSFNALLKTLEEPPSHVKFILATTDPQKLPVTILSRCLQFNLKRLPVAQISAHLADVLTQEQIENEPAALAVLSRAADGSMRDALSLLDQAIAFGEGGVFAASVEAMLGSASESRLLELLEAIAERDISRALALLRALDDFAPDYEVLLADLLQLFHTATLMQLMPDAQYSHLAEPERLQAVTTKLGPQDVQVCYDIALKGRRDLAWVPDTSQGMEMIVMRMVAFLPDTPSRASAQKKTEQSPQITKAPPPTAPETPVAPAPIVEKTNSTAGFEKTEKTEKTHESPPWALSEPPESSIEQTKSTHSSEPPETKNDALLAISEPQADVLTSEDHSPEQAVEAVVTAAGDRAPNVPMNLSAQTLQNNEQWLAWARTLQVQGMTGQLLSLLSFVSWENDLLTLALDPIHLGLRGARTVANLSEQLKTQLQIAQLQIVDATGDEMTLAQMRINEEQAAAAHAKAMIMQDPLVCALQQQFGAVVAEGSIVPLSHQ